MFNMSTLIISFDSWDHSPRPPGLPEIIQWHTIARWKPRFGGTTGRQSTSHSPCASWYGKSRCVTKMACRNHVQLEIDPFTCSLSEQAHVQFCWFVPFLLGLQLSWAEMTQQLRRPESLYCIAHCWYLAWYFHPLKFLCQCFISNVFALATVACPIWMAYAQDGCFEGGGWMMVRSLQWRNAYLPCVVDDGQFSLVPNYADKFN